MSTGPRLQRTLIQVSEWSSEWCDMEWTTLRRLHGIQAVTCQSVLARGVTQHDIAGKTHLGMCESVPDSSLQAERSCRAYLCRYCRRYSCKRSSSSPCSPWLLRLWMSSLNRSKALGVSPRNQRQTIRVLKVRLIPVHGLNVSASLSNNHTKARNTNRSASPGERAVQTTRDNEEELMSELRLMLKLE